MKITLTPIDETNREDGIKLDKPTFYAFFEVLQST